MMIPGRRIHLILVIALCQLVIISCTHRSHPEGTVRKDQDIPNKAQSRKLKDFNAAENNQKNKLATKKTVQGTVSIDSHGEEKKLDAFLENGISRKINKSLNPDEIVNTAHEFLGVPHCMGGLTKKCIDCSGLLVAVFARNGVHLPHNSEELARYGSIIASSTELMKGDLVFFIKSYRTRHFITHSGIYIGNNEFIHASARSGVTITSMDDPYWKARFIFGTRVAGATLP